MTDPIYVPLRIHTAHSLLEGAIKSKELAKVCAKLGMPAAAITDTNSLAGIVEFSKSLSGAGIQPIIGCQIDLAHPGARGEETSQVVLLVKDKTGYGNLVKILSNAALAEKGPRASLADLKALNAGLILLSGGARGPIDRALAANDRERAETRLQSFAKIFGDRFYLEIQRTGAPDETVLEAQILELARKHQVAIVATNEAFFLTPDLHEAHDALLCIAEGTYVAAADRRRVSKNAWLKGPEEMAALFRDLPEALANTVAIAQRCAFMFEKSKPMLPAYPGLDGKTEDEVVRERAAAGLAQRLAQLKIPADQVRTYEDRLAFELDVIVKMGFSGYFLIVSDFIQWAKTNGIAVGPGRGSGAGSLVAFSLQITNLDPIRYGLLFERFLNPDRVSMPDFDIDFCQERRHEVIAYVKSRYGAERVAQIGTYGKLQARAVVRDVGRVLQIPYPVVDRFSKMIPNNPAHPTSLADAMKLEPLASELQRADTTIRKLFDIALRLEGLYRNASTHAAGVVIADRAVTDIVPVMKDPEGNVVTQFDMKSVEEAGLVKFDFLGLKTLDVIQGAIQLAAEGGETIDLEAVGVEDDATYAMLAEADSFGVFQLESAGMRQAMRQIVPTNIDDIIALVSLYRPGPMENIPSYANVKHGREPASYLHPLMERVLKDTYGIIIYQEQVMELARRLAGYTLGQADLLRRAMGKKIKAEMDAQTEVFVKGAEANGLSRETAEAIFALLAKFADYGFNKSHAAAYALVAFQTGYLKRHYPHEFFAASMNMDLDKVEKLAEFYRVARETGLEILPPDINASQARFTVVRNGGTKAIRYALAAVRGVGVDAMDRLIVERKKGPFTSLDDLVRRSSAFLNRKAYESLVRCGALDGISKNRGALLAGIDVALKEAQSETKRLEMGQASFFDTLIPVAKTRALPDVPDLPRFERLAGEYDTLGLYLTGHPIDAAKGRLQRIRALRIADIFDLSREIRGDVRFGGLLLKRQIKMTKKQEPMAVLTLSDPSGACEAVAFDEEFNRLRDLMEEGKAFVVTAGVGEREGQRRLFIRNLEPLPLDIPNG